MRTCRKAKLHHWGPYERLEVNSISVRRQHSRIEITAITDPQARVNALIAGDMHLISDVDAKMIKLIESSDGVHINSTKSGRYGGICCLKNTWDFHSNQCIIAGNCMAHSRRNSHSFIYRPAHFHNILSMS